MYYGCFFCVTGQEDAVIQRMRKKCDLHIISPVKLRYHRKKGIFSIRTGRVFPGYLFFSTDHRDLKVEYLENTQGIIRLLKYDDDNWVLSGSDAEIVSELFDCAGVIGFSKGQFVDGRLRIREGFLKRYEDDICSVDRRHRAAIVRMKLNNRVLEAWFGYDIDGDEPESNLVTIKPSH